MSDRTFFSATISVGLLLVAGCTTVPTTTDATPPTSAAAGDTTVVAIAAPTKAACSVFDLLGVQQVAACTHKVRDCIASQLGMLFPGLEPKPPLLLISDPANLSPDAPPAVQAAADVKQKEDQAAQKIKGIRYLATIGCGGCYPDVEEALLKSLEDCTEAVRYETALALRETVGRECSYCAEKACCSEKIQKKLYEMLEMDANGCYREPSERVRRQIRLSLRACGPVAPVVEETTGEGDGNGGGANGESVKEGPGGPGPEVPPPDDELDRGDELIPPPGEARFSAPANRLSAQAQTVLDSALINW